jgi:hypothetical protein
MVGIAIGAGIFAHLYPYLSRSILNRGTFPAETIPELVGVRPWIVVIVVAILIAGFLYMLTILGF